MYDIYIKNFKTMSGSMHYDEQLLYSVPMSAEEENALIDPVVSGEMGRAGSLEFSIYPDHPYYESFQQMKTIIRVVYDGTTLFRGRVLTIDTTFNGIKKFHCEGDFAFLLDSVYPGEPEDERPKTDVLTYIRLLIHNHNTQVVEGFPDKKFELGEVPGLYSSSIQAPQKISAYNDYKYGSNGWDTTSSALEELSSSFGGYWRTRYVNGEAFLDWMDSYFNPNVNAQPIQIGYNLIDLSSTAEVNNIFTALIPIGRKENEDVYIDGYKTEVHGDNRRILVPQIVSQFSEAELTRGYHTLDDYTEAVNRYGIIYKTVQFDNADTKEKLWNYAIDWIKNNYVGGITSFDLSALDMHNLGYNVEKLLCGDRVRVIYPDVSKRVDGQKPPMIDRVLTCTSMTLDLHNPEKNQYHIGVPSSILNKSYGEAVKTSKAQSTGSTSGTSTSSVSSPSYTSTNTGGGSGGITSQVTKPPSYTPPPKQPDVEKLEYTAKQIVTNEYFNHDRYIEEYPMLDSNTRAATLNATALQIEQILKGEEEETKKALLMQINGGPKILPAEMHDIELYGPRNESHPFAVDDFQKQLYYDSTKNKITMSALSDYVKEDPLFILDASQQQIKGLIPRQSSQQKLVDGFRASIGLDTSTGKASAEFESNVVAASSSNSSTGIMIPKVLLDSFTSKLQVYKPAADAVTDAVTKTLEFDGITSKIKVFTGTGSGTDSDKTVEINGETGDINAGRDSTTGDWLTTLRGGLVTAKDFKISQKYDSVAAELGKFDTLIANKIDASEIYANYLSADEIEADYAKIDDLVASNILVADDPEHSTVLAWLTENGEDISALSGLVADKITAYEGRFHTIETDYLKTDNLLTTIANVTAAVTSGSFHANNYVTVGNGTYGAVYSPDFYFGDSENSRSLKNGVLAVRVVPDGNNYRLEYATWNTTGDDWTSGGTFSRATSLEGTWGSGSNLGTYTVRATPQNEVISTKIYPTVAQSGTPQYYTSAGNHYVKQTKILYAEDPDNPGDAGSKIFEREISILANEAYEAGQNDANITDVNAEWTGTGDGRTYVVKVKIGDRDYTTIASTTLDTAYSRSGNPKWTSGYTNVSQDIIISDEDGNTAIKVNVDFDTDEAVSYGHGLGYIEGYNANNTAYLSEGSQTINPGEHVTIYARYLDYDGNWHNSGDSCTITASGERELSTEWAKSGDPSWESDYSGVSQDIIVSYADDGSTAVVLDDVWFDTSRAVNYGKNSIGLTSGHWDGNGTFTVETTGKNVDLERSTTIKVSRDGEMYQSNGLWAYQPYIVTEEDDDTVVAKAGTISVNIGDVMESVSVYPIGSLTTVAPCLLKNIFAITQLGDIVSSGSYKMSAYNLQGEAVYDYAWVEDTITTQGSPVYFKSLLYTGYIYDGSGNRLGYGEVYFKVSGTGDQVHTYYNRGFEITRYKKGDVNVHYQRGDSKALYTYQEGTTAYARGTIKTGYNYPDTSDIVSLYSSGPKTTYYRFK